jgi:transposase
MIFLINSTTIPIDTVTGKRRETIAEERVSVIEKKAEGKSYREIAEISGISKSSITEIVRE